MRRYGKKPLQEVLKKNRTGPIQPWAEQYFDDIESGADNSGKADQVIRSFQQAMNNFGSLNPEFANASKAFAGLVSYLYTKLERLEEQVETYEILLGAIFGQEAEREFLIRYLTEHTETKNLAVVELIDKVYRGQDKKF